MTNEMTALAQRAVACRAWRWMPGMLADGFRVCRVDADGYKFGYAAEYNYAYAVVGDVLPDLTDPATLGCLLALVREAHGQSTLSPVMIGRNRWCLADFGTTALDGNTEAALLVAALEAAP